MKAKNDNSFIVFVVWVELFDSIIIIIIIVVIALLIILVIIIILTM
jgi:hypothetical protein